MTSHHTKPFTSLTTGKSLRRLVPIIITCMVVLMWNSAQAQEMAKVSYRNISGNRVVFTVAISSPAPKSMVIQHFHSPENRLVRSSPQAQQIDNRRGFAKWLLRGLRPGVNTFSLSFTNEVDRRSLRLNLRYWDQNNGRFYEKSARP